MTQKCTPCTTTHEGRDLPITEPAVDIIRGEDRLTLVADMPGVDDSSLSVDLNNDVLAITGRSLLVEDGSSYSEFGPVEYRRSFKLGEQVNRDGIKASMKNGILRVEMPMLPKHQPRKIQVEIH